MINAFEITMKHILLILTAIVLFASCNKSTKTNQDKNSLTFNEQQAAAMTVIACYEAQGDLISLESAIHNGLEADLTAGQIKEALSQLSACAGIPRSLNALGVLQRVIGDTSARDNLTYTDLELVTVSALAGLDGVEPQLAAHVRDARNMGLTDAQLLAIPTVLQECVGKMEAHRVAVAIQQLGIKDSLNDHFASDIYVQNYVDLKSSWRRGEPNTAYAQYFIGNSYLAPYNGGMVNVSFEPGCRNNWHIHHKQVQVLVCVYGRGWYQEWGKPAVKLEPGVVIEIPEGVKHWHGAAKDSWMQHLTYHKDVQEGASNEWLEPVDDEVYGKLK